MTTKPLFISPASSMAEWVADNVGGVFRFLTYRRMFTPYEIAVLYNRR